MQLAGDDVNPGQIFGLFHAKPGSTDSDRLRWELLASVPGKLTGVAAWDGHTVVSTSEEGHYYRTYASVGTNVEMPSSALTGRGPGRWPTFLEHRRVVAVDDVGLVRSDDLVSWKVPLSAQLPSGERRI